MRKNEHHICILYNHLNISEWLSRLLLYLLFHLLLFLLSSYLLPWFLIFFCYLCFCFFVHYNTTSWIPWCCGLALLSVTWCITTDHWQGGWGGTSLLVASIPSLQEWVQGWCSKYLERFTCCTPPRCLRDQPKLIGTEDSLLNVKWSIWYSKSKSWSRSNRIKEPSWT